MLRGLKTPELLVLAFSIAIWPRTQVFSESNFILN
ncbi:hypothetical protein Q31a_58000 [Aureliella helgolandensis]|uniref:Uncharacterized protein n=1 Tax=Aureliella helgolandensis TaxID=2527968 RepID=A0A518GFN2_9BACT|nr:hypothetical protein Q31a_58000 [Aureliella helgolandensis]